MINHVRTWLLDDPPPATTTGPGEEFVDPRFTPVWLPPLLAAARDRLFGVGHDRYGRLVTAARVLAAADANPALYAAVRRDDPRVTYAPPYPVPADAVAGPPGATLRAGADPLTAPGRGAAEWLVAVPAAGPAAVTFDGGTTAVAVTSGAVPLPGSAFALAVPGAGTWRATVYRPPAHPATALAAWADAVALFAAVDADLLGVWRAGPCGYDRAAAAAVALARRTAELAGG